ncbi:YlxM family DNA-binding protein [Aerococcaceae bacterium NML191292]|nr:YlxM family DNA-binding protein [Aerococcaceae bacterium NML210727]MCW6654151.1 YlxM family DNA-binding protein [Aerococcaceae bacterium NML201296]MCW6659808.1 YlxM family DNA-binding protein [Aerococcaceae bacterium NML191292]MCW6661774.1 YlxM family DNA-binding protein [Aerococcaceae bacterium NML201209]MCW6665920.1 YlxM family DNA-binding protein [Aerococcaceae bacterium NML191219]MCW6666426.1 YlxM family DNA-binding protein [Aerococcaceae bacterium NML190938]MCW6677026.1 YlxM family DN
MNLAKTVRMNQLFGFYQTLLTDKQQQMLQLYYEEDYSLAEIADYYSISRQAVHDNLKRAEKLLEEYESNLQLLERRHKRVKLLAQLLELTADQPDAQSLIQTILQMDE